MVGLGVGKAEHNADGRDRKCVLTRGKAVKHPFALRLERYVLRSPISCSWCDYPMVELDPAYAFIVDGKTLQVNFCSARCAHIESRFKQRGPLRVAYER